MEFYKDLYVSEFLEKKRNKLVRDIRHKESYPSIYVIALPACDHNQLELYSSIMLKQKVYDRDDLFIVGIADGYDDALMIVQRIYDDVLLKTGNTDVRRYLEENRRKGGK